MFITLRFYKKFILIVALILSMLSELLYFNSGFGPISFILILSPLLFFTIIYLYNEVVFNKFLMPIYLFMSLLVVYSFLGSMYFGQVGLLAQIYSFFVMPLMFIYLGFFVDKNIEVALNTILVSLLICSFFSLSEFLYYSYGFLGPFNVFMSLSDIVLDSQLMFMPSPIYGRATGFFVNPNVLGLYGGLAYWLTRFIQNNNFYWQASVIKSLCVLCILLSFSRTSLIGIILSTIIIYILNIFISKSISDVKSIIKSFFYLILALTMVYYSSSYITEYQFERLSEIGMVTAGGIEQSSNLSGRFDAWSTIFNYVEINPFGTIVPPQLIVSDSPDNQFIYFFAQGGYLLLLVTVFFYIYLIYKGVVYGRKSNFAFLGGCIFFLISSFTLVPLNIFIVSLFWMMIGMQAKSSKYLVRTSFFNKI